MNDVPGVLPRYTPLSPRVNGGRQDYPAERGMLALGTHRETVSKFRRTGKIVPR